MPPLVPAPRPPRLLLNIPPVPTAPAPAVEQEPRSAGKSWCFKGSAYLNRIHVTASDETRGAALTGELQSQRMQRITADRSVLAEEKRTSPPGTIRGDPIWAIIRDLAPPARVECRCLIRVPLNPAVLQLPKPAANRSVRSVAPVQQRLQLREAQREYSQEPRSTRRVSTGGGPFAQAQTSCNCTCEFPLCALARDPRPLVPDL